MGPAIAALQMGEPIGFGDRGCLGKAVRFNSREVDARGFKTFVDGRTVDTRVDDQMNDVNALRSQFARHRLSHGPQSEFRSRKCREAFASAQTGGRTREQHSSPPTYRHVFGRFTTNEEPGVTGELPSPGEKLFGGLKDRLVHVRSGVEEAHLDGSYLLFDLRKQLLHLLFPSCIHRKRMEITASLLQLFAELI